MGDLIAHVKDSTHRLLLEHPGKAITDVDTIDRDRATFVKKYLKLN